MIRFSIGDVSEDRPALFVRLDFITDFLMQDSVDWASFNFLELLGGMEEKEEACCISVCWLPGRDLYLSIAGDVDEPVRGAPLGQGQGVEDPRAGRRSGFPSGNSLGFFRTISLAGGCLFRHPNKGAEKPPSEGHPLGVSYTHIHDRVRSQIQAGKSSTSTTSGFPALFGSRTPLGTPCFYKSCPP